MATQDTTQLSLNLQAQTKAESLLKEYEVNIKKNPQYALPQDIMESEYQPKDDAQKDTIALIRKHMTYGELNMQTPRTEFNDLSCLYRGQVDQLSFNLYQPNNGEADLLDQINGWRSRSVSPIVRNKCISTAAHATARLIYPKVFAYDQSSDEQKDAAQVMRDLVEWSCDQSGYDKAALGAVLASMTDPHALLYTEYTEAYRTVKRKQPDGTFKTETILDERFSGFKDTIVPYDQLYFENFYEPDIQKQGWLIWRRVISYTNAQAKYAGKYENFKYVQPGVQTIFNDANQSFYNVYDFNMRGEEVEEILYWNQALDLFQISVNGVLLTDPENPNPRQDKMLPFAKMFFEVINNRCFSGKSLACKLQTDAVDINQVRSMFIDGTYLSIFPAMAATGSDSLNSQVIVPGLVTTFEDPQSTLTPITTGMNLQAGTNALQMLTDSVNDTAVNPVGDENPQPQASTAYEIQQIQNNAATVLGLFVKMISDFTNQYGKLRMGDIIQYLTLPEVSAIEGTDTMNYKAFLMPQKATGKKSKKIMFDGTLPDGSISSDDKLALSYATLTEELEKGGHQEIYKVNPTLFMNLQYICKVTPDVQNPMSEELERAYNLEAYDRLINNPVIDPEQVTKDFLLGVYPTSANDPEKYISKQAQQQASQPQNPINATQLNGQPQGQPQGQLASPPKNYA